MEEITYQPIGTIHTPFQKAAGTPIQPAAGKGIQGKVAIRPDCQKGLQDLSGFSHIILLYHMHKAREFRLLTKPFMDDQKRGIFSIRAPARPNSIGFSIVKLIKIEENILYIQDVDILDGTPLLDIKPWVSEFDQREAFDKGWLEENIHKLSKTRDDGRFEEDKE